MKRIIALIMVALMAVSLVACGSEKEINETGPVSTDAVSNNNTAENSCIEIDAKSANQVIYEKNNIKITYNDLKQSEYSDPYMEFFIENNSEEDITVTSRTASVNNAVFGTAMFIAEINAGQNSTNHIYIHDDDCKAYGITEIGVVEFSIIIAKKGSFETIDDTDTFKFVFNESAVIPFESDGEMIYSKNGISVYKEQPALEDDDYYDQIARLFVVNDTNEPIMIALEDLVANGAEMSTLSTAKAPAGNVSYTNLYLYKDDLAANNINSAEKVEFSIKFMNAETINDIDKSEILTIDLK